MKNLQILKKIKKTKIKIRLYKNKINKNKDIKRGKNIFNDILFISIFLWMKYIIQNEEFKINDNKKENKNNKEKYYY